MTASVSVLVVLAGALVACPDAAAAYSPQAPVKPAAPSAVVNESAASAKARSAGVPVEVSALTSETRLVMANPSGSFTLTQNARPVRVRKSGTWVPVDLTLVRGTDGSISPTAAPTQLAFSGGGSGPLVRIGSGTSSVALTWPSGALPAPVLSGEMATYANVLPNVDLRLTADADGYSEVLVVKTAAAAANPALKSLRFGLTTTGVSAGKDRAGNIDFRDSGGDVLFHAPTPTMWDTPGAATTPQGKPAPQAADGDTPADEPTRAEMGVEVTSGAVTVTPDQAMLSDAGTRFPVYLDPSVSAGRRAWTSVWASHPTTSFWNSSENVARVGHESQEGNTNRSLFWMATDAVKYKHILTATFRANNTWSWSCSARAVDLWLTGGISSSTTWKSQPSWMRKIATANASKGNEERGCGDGYLEWNALSAVAQQAAAGWPGVTVGLRASETDEFAWKKFQASSVAMIVEYNTVPAAPTATSVSENKPCATGAGRPVIATQTPTMYASMRDADAGQNLRARFQWWIPNGTAPKGEFVTAMQNPNSTVFQGQVPAGLFPDGGDISWRVRAEDGTDVGPYSPWCEYHINAQHPEHAPTVTSTAFPTGGAVGNGVGRTGTFAFAPNGETDVARYAYAFNSTALDRNRTVPATGTGLTATLSFTPAADLDNYVTVWTLNSAGTPGPATQYYFVVDASTPVAGQWLLNDGTGGSAADSSSSGTHPLTLPSSGTSWTAGRDKGGLAFTASSAAAASGGAVADASKPVTVSAWVSLASTTASSTVIGLGGSRTTALSLQYVAASKTWALRATSADTDTPTITTATGGPTPAAGVWTHLTGVYDPGGVGATQLRLYVNGVQAAAAALPALWSAGGVRVGGDLQAGVNAVPLQGTADGVRVWDRVLADNEITAVATEAVLMGRWGFDEGAGATAADLSGHGQTATGTNMIWAERPPGFAFEGNGSNAYATTNGPPVRTDTSFTLSAWVRVVNPTTYSGVVCQDGAVSSGYFLQYRKETNRWSFAMPTSDTTDPVQVRIDSTVVGIDPDAPEEWVFLTAVYDAPHKQMRLYVDGVTSGDGGPAAATAPATVWNAAGPVHIGACRYNSGLWNQFPGQLDDVRVYSGVLSNQQILDLYNETP